MNIILNEFELNKQKVASTNADFQKKNWISSRCPLHLFIFAALKNANCLHLKLLVQIYFTSLIEFIR